MEMEQRSIMRGRIGEREREEEEENFLRLIISNVPNSVWLEILYKLPVKSIFKFKSVSKSWLSLFSDPSFAASYTARNPAESTWILLYRKLNNILSPRDDRLYLLDDHHQPSQQGFTLEFLSAAASGRDDQKPPIFVVAASNGLLLSTATRGSHDCYYVSNPLTKQWAALPQPPRIHQRVSLGFIVKPCDGSFQVVRIGGYTGSSTILNFEIFSSKTHQWKEKSFSFDLPVYEMVSMNRAVPCKQILYWMDKDKIVAYDSSQGDCENDENIRCHLIDLPRDRVLVDPCRRDMIGVCQDNLHYFQVANRIQILSIWELRKYNGGGEGEWFLLHRIRSDEVHPAPLNLVMPLALHPFDSDLVYLHNFSSPVTIVSLNWRSRVVENCIPVEAVITWATVFSFVLPTWPTPVPRISPTPV